jgi:hypothetical protein
MPRKNVNPRIEGQSLPSEISQGQQINRQSRGAALPGPRMSLPDFPAPAPYRTIKKTREVNRAYNTYQ